MDKSYLLTPGPTPLPPQVQEALGRPIIHHRTDAYRALFGRVLQGLKTVMQTTRDAVVLTSSGTGAMEAAVCNTLSPGDEAIVILGGKFAERWQHLCQGYGIRVVTVPVAYGDAVDPEQVRRALTQTPKAKAVFATLCETSTGVAHDLQAVASVVQPSGALLIVDAISGLLAEECRTEEWGIDVLVGGSQKALMLPPGLAFLSLSDKAWALVEQARGPRFYFDLRLYRKALRDDDTPFTSSVSLVVALDAALALILKAGVAETLKRGQLMAQATRAGVEAMGLALFAKRPANAVTAAVVPSGIDGKRLLKQLEQRYRVTLAGGQGEMAGKIIRVAHMGYIGPGDLLVAIGALELVLLELGMSMTPGEGLRAAQAVMGNLTPTAAR